MTDGGERVRVLVYREGVCMYVRNTWNFVVVNAPRLLFEASCAFLFIASLSYRSTRKSFSRA